MQISVWQTASCPNLTKWNAIMRTEKLKIHEFGPRGFKILSSFSVDLSISWLMHPPRGSAKTAMSTKL